MKAFIKRVKKALTQLRESLDKKLRSPANIPPYPMAKLEVPNVSADVKNPFEQEIN